MRGISPNVIAVNSQVIPVEAHPQGKQIFIEAFKLIRLKTSKLGEKKLAILYSLARSSKSKMYISM